MKQYSFMEFMDIIRELRSEHGCPWDREQTHESLKPCLIEESYEVLEAIDNKDRDNLCEELGDVLLQVVMHTVMAEEEQQFTMEDVITGVSEKMIRRHPHVFGEVTVENSEEVLKNWDEIKKQEKKATGDEKISIEQELKKIPHAFPATIRASKVQKVAKKSGMDFNDIDQVFDKVNEELEELKNALKQGGRAQIDEEFGDLLFTMINLSRFLSLNAENSLTNATNKFINRFVNVFANAEKSGKNLCDLSPEEQDVLWGQAKDQ